MNGMPHSPRFWRRALVATLLLVSALFVTGSALHHVALAQETTLFVDTMDDPANGLLDPDSPDPSQFRFGYENGEYIIEAFAPDYSGELYAFLRTEPFENTRLTVDVRIQEPVDGRYALAGCRAGIEHDGYLFEFYPENGGFRFWRMDPSGAVQLGETGFAELFQGGGQVNAIGIECLDNVITGIVNGQPVGTIGDDAYQSGYSYIGAGVVTNVAGPIVSAFDNLELEVLATLGLAPTPTSEAPPDPPLQPTQGVLPDEAPPAPPDPTEAPPPPPGPTEAPPPLPPLPPPPGAPTEQPSLPPLPPPPGVPTPQSPVPPMGAEGEFSQLRNQALASPSVGGPYGGTLPQEPGTINFASFGLSLTDAYLSVLFGNPTNTLTPWDVGVSIRSAGGDEQIRLILTSNGEWYATVGSDAPYASGMITNFLTGPGQENQVEVIASGATGYFAVNGVFAGAFDLSERQVAGDFGVASGFSSSNALSGRSATYRNLQLWAIPE
jgi:hypothetical protein